MVKDADLRAQCSARPVLAAAVMPQQSLLQNLVLDVSAEKMKLEKVQW